MKVPLKKEIYELENQTASRFGIPKLVLMENAGSAIYHFIESQIGDARNKRFLVICGPGNNGGDGAVVARKLFLGSEKGSVVAVMIGKTQKGIQEEAAVNFRILEKMAVPTVRYRSLKDLGKVKAEIKKCDVIIDAIYGIGFREKKDARMERLIVLVNGSGKTVISVDLPSGVMADGGTYHPVKARYTVSFAFPKLGTLDYPGREFTGKRFVFPIDLPREIAEAPKVRRELITPESAKKMMIQRKPDTHKGTYGHLLLIGGNSDGAAQSMAGAVVLAGMAALRSGTGLLTVAAPSKIIPVIQKDLPEAMTVSLSGDDKDEMKILNDIIVRKKIRSVLIGNGFGTGSRQKKILELILKNKAVRKLVVDADGLNNLSESPELQKKLLSAGRSGKEIVITPHVKEMGRLVKQSADAVKKNKMGIAAGYSKKNRVVTALKDAISFISSADGSVRINETGSPALAKGGSGDVLAGIIAGLFTSGYDGFSAASLGCYILGRAGEIYAEKYGAESALSRDIVNFIPECFRELHNG